MRSSTSCVSTRSRSCLRAGAQRPVCSRWRGSSCRSARTAGSRLHRPRGLDHPRSRCTFRGHFRSRCGSANPPEENGPPLKAGMYARVTLPTGPTQHALLVPKDALVLGGPSPVVLLLMRMRKSATRGKVRPVAVELGVTVRAVDPSQRPLDGRTTSVVRGNERLRPGQDVSCPMNSRPNRFPFRRNANPHATP